LEAFEDWYRREHPRMVATLLLATGDTELASEAVDEARAPSPVGGACRPWRNRRASCDRPLGSSVNGASSRVFSTRCNSAAQDWTRRLR
jgi:hypothetical protein